MGKEIERKYLVDPTKWNATEKAEGNFIHQGYLSVEPERTVRVRLVDKKAFLTIKGKNEGSVRTEYEYEIPAEDASEMLDELCIYKLSKIRYKVLYEGKIWEVDEFSGNHSGLIIAEIELNDVDEKFELPLWVKEEVTHDSRYFNSNLAQSTSVSTTEY
ncbi:MAG: CYTH domain-containing protein [Saprospiraceae bacterium]|nr:CYTH domain-containing protein [Saprospiraceae bacterium]